jgi:hypothetical protein
LFCCTAVVLRLCLAVMFVYRLIWSTSSTLWLRRCGRAGFVSHVTVHCFVRLEEYGGLDWMQVVLWLREVRPAVSTSLLWCAVQGDVRFLMTDIHHLLLHQLHSLLHRKLKQFLAACESHRCAKALRSWVCAAWMSL